METETVTRFSDEAETCEECKAEEFTIEHGAIKGPGKFEGEPLETFHAYHVMLDGGADDEIASCWRVGNVIAEETEQGFVGSTIYDTAGEASDVFDALAESEGYDA